MRIRTNNYLKREQIQKLDDNNQAKSKINKKRKKRIWKNNILVNTTSLLLENRNSQFIIKKIEFLDFKLIINVLYFIKISFFY